MFYLLFILKKLCLSSLLTVLGSCFDLIFTTNLGLEDQALLFCFVLNHLFAKFVFIDTNKHFIESKRFLELLKTNIKIDIIKINWALVLNFKCKFRDLNIYCSVFVRKSCCNFRKVMCLKCVLLTNLWVTGLTKYQSVNRSNLSFVFVDVKFDVLKLNPLLFWTQNNVNAYLVALNIKTHFLFKQSYKSLGCEPCTRPTKSSESVRAGRWWWENHSSSECGLHTC